MRSARSVSLPGDAIRSHRPGRLGGEIERAVVRAHVPRQGVRVEDALVDRWPELLDRTPWIARLRTIGLVDRELVESRSKRSKIEMELVGRDDGKRNGLAARVDASIAAGIDVDVQPERAVERNAMQREGMRPVIRPRDRERRFVGVA